MQKIEKVKLKNGLEINFLFDKKFTTSSIQMCFKIGWRNDTESERGLAHLFEHLVGKRTKKYSGKSEFAKKLDQEGIVSNAWTGPDMTVYYQNQTNRQLLTSLDLFYEAIYNTEFVGEDLEKEKEIVLNEAKRYLDNDGSVLWRQTIKNLYPGTTMEKFFFGDRETMKNITLKHFEDFYRIYRNPKNSILFVGTNDIKSKKKVLDFLNKFYANVDNKKLFSNHIISTYKDVPGKIIKYSLIEKPHKELSSILLYYRTRNTSPRENIVGSVIVSMLVGGLTSKMMQILRDEMGLVYGIGIDGGDYLQGIHYGGFQTSCDKDKKDLVIKSIKEILINFTKTVTQEDINLIIPKREYSIEKPIFVGSDIESLIDCVFYKNKYIQREEYLKILKSVNVKEVKKLLKEMFDEEKSTICVLE